MGESLEVILPRVTQSQGGRRLRCGELLASEARQGLHAEELAQLMCRAPPVRLGVTDRHRALVSLLQRPPQSRFLSQLHGQDDFRRGDTGDLLQQRRQRRIMGAAPQLRLDGRVQHR